MRFLKVAISAVLMFVAVPSFASILVEPYVGYNIGSSKQSIGTTESKSDITGAGVGLRLGPSFGPLFVALDASYSTIDLDMESGADQNGSKRTAVGAVLGVNVPILPLRGWIGYNFMDDVKTKDNGTYKGVSPKIGAGFTILSLVGVNVEYIMSTYDELKGSGGTVKFPTTILGTTVDKLKANVILFSVSVPLNL